MSEQKKGAIGRVVQVIGPVLDIQFEEGHLPAIYNAVHITSEGFQLKQPLDVTAEVQQHLGEGRVRAIAMEPTEGMVRGMKAEDTGQEITVPVGRATLGRVLNVLGSPWTNLGRSTPTPTIPSTVPHRRSKTSPRRWRCLRLESRW